MLQGKQETKSLAQLSGAKLTNVKLFYREINSPRLDGFTSNAPLLLVIEPTSRCNFKCVHCSQSRTSRPPADLSLELFQAVVPAVKTALEVYIFGDGEALLDIPRHLAMIERIYRENPACVLGFSTNGKLLTPAVYSRYSVAGIGYIQLSIDAATKELYEAMRRGGSFDELVANLEGIAALRGEAKARQPRLHLATVISKQNFHQLPSLAEFAKRYKFSFWFINAEYPHNPGRDLLALTQGDLAELERMRAEIIRHYGSYYATVFDPSIGLRLKPGAEPFESKAPVFCTVPWQRFELKANGDVKVCPYFHEPIRSMNGDSLMEVWNGQEFRRIRRAFASGAGIPSYCIKCDSGMRRQYLPGSATGSDVHDVSLFARLARRGRAITGRILG